MREQPLISILLAAYNVSSYIDRCMDTLLNQTYRNIEIIIVDDGSTDDTGQICDLYAERYDHVKVIHTPNGGLSVARNVGLDNANGKYIGFVDPDDYISVDMYEKLYVFLEDNDCDIVICGRYNFYKKKEKRVILHSEQSEILEKETAMGMLFNDTLGSQSWEKFYSKELWDNIRFIPGRVYAEDVAIMHLVFEQARRIGSLAEPLYYYFINDDTLTTSYRPFKWMSTYLAFKERLEFAEKKYPNMTTELKSITINFARLTLDNYFQRKEECDEPYIEEIINRIKISRSVIWKLRSMKFYNKLMIEYYCLAPKLYEKTIGVIHRIFYFFKPNSFR